MLQSLEKILTDTGFTEICGKAGIGISHVSFSSRTCIGNSVFVAVKGVNADGHKFIDDAVKHGATAIVCEVMPAERAPEVTYVKVPDSSFALGIICDNYFDHPSAKLKLVGVTGTNGKTTIATLLYNAFRQLGFKSGLLSTICYKVNDTEYPATHTTPDPFMINKLLSEMVETGCEYAFMEVSSHAVVQHRIAGLTFAGGIFTNITHDHLDYHKTFESYIEAKKGFFDKLPAAAFAITNTDDRNGGVMIQSTKARRFTYGLRQMADFKCRMIESCIDGMQLNIDGTDLWCKLSGTFNAYNITAIYAAAILLGQEKSQVLTVLSGLDPAEGRFESIKDKHNVVAIIDYAHTPDALKNVLSTINQAHQGEGRIITVVGAGGDRDKTKRPEMGKIAAEMSQQVILTSDNPRTEDPEKILDDILTGIGITEKKKVLVIANRKEAIKTAYVMAQPGDIILIAGKGHEKYQEIMGVRHPFDDKQIIKDLMDK
ncbi:MAG TPA: UDP-N-acetylmuramoyl-L-alanyl-D-glutamate--2,6-diaminopimelate ligase [Bacteroidales bacterium]|nr:UDP-N-acetylmuramoyl-L-alanyl-D-glutamate--2,6-diaminopimelate ligase [Bacteroidales bacterium]